MEGRRYTLVQNMLRDSEPSSTILDDHGIFMDGKVHHYLRPLDQDYHHSK